jgi:Na+(H+)/acetate symporter ActP
VTATVRRAKPSRQNKAVGDPAQKPNVAFPMALAFAVAASANLPSLIYNLSWRRFNTRGAVWAIYGGLITCVGLVFFDWLGTVTSRDRAQRERGRPPLGWL